MLGQKQNTNSGAGGLYLHGGDDHAPVHDELSQSSGAFVAVSAVNHQQTADVFELSYREVGRQRRLFPFLKNTQS